MFTKDATYRIDKEILESFLADDVIVDDFDIVENPE